MTISRELGKRFVLGQLKRRLRNQIRQGIMKQDEVNAFNMKVFENLYISTLEH